MCDLPQWPSKMDARKKVSFHCGSRHSTPLQRKIMRSHVELCAKPSLRLLWFDWTNWCMNCWRWLWFAFLIRFFQKCTVVLEIKRERLDINLSQRLANLLHKKIDSWQNPHRRSAIKSTTLHRPISLAVKTYVKKKKRECQDTHAADSSQTTTYINAWTYGSQVSTSHELNVKCIPCNNFHLKINSHFNKWYFEWVWNNFLKTDLH